MFPCDADGCVYAVHGWYGGDRAHPYVRADAWSRAYAYHRVDGTRKCVYSNALRFHFELTSLAAVIGDRERCLQAGMDDHITSECYATRSFCRSCETDVLCRAITQERPHELHQQACGRAEDGTGTQSAAKIDVPHAEPPTRVPVNRYLPTSFDSPAILHVTRSRPFSPYCSPRPLIAAPAHPHPHCNSLP